MNLIIALYLWVTHTRSIIDNVGFESLNPICLATNFDHDFVIKWKAIDIRILQITFGFKFKRPYS
jgi:hypothetical protein